MMGFPSRNEIRIRIVTGKGIKEVSRFGSDATATVTKKLRRGGQEPS